VSLLASWAPAPAGAQEGGKRVALIVGNDAYSMRPLQNAVNDARLVDKLLRDAGFRTILKENAGKAAMEQGIIDFLGQIGPDDTALFYYAGHGVQIQQENFLVPADFAAANSIVEAKYKCVSLPQFISNLKERGPKRTIIILDACRSNPLAAAQSLQAGLAQPLNLGNETYIAFSTSPNSVATDNPNGRNSYFTQALADFVAQPGLTIDEAFTQVRNRVFNATDKAQNPWSQTSLTAKFYFHPPSVLEATNDPSMVEKWIADAGRREQRGEWPEAIEGLNQVIAKRPGGELEEAAKAKLPYLTARRDAQARYEAADFAAAAALYEKALSFDPFATDAAMQGADSYLLNDQLPEALRLLKAVRVRGNTESIGKTDLMLKELAAVYPDAAQELKNGIPQPPPAGQIFSGMQFGVPDFDAGKRHLQTSPVELARWFKELSVAPVPASVASSATLVTSVEARPAAAAPASPPAAPITIDAFHLEVISSLETRDLALRAVNQASQASADYGYLQLEGPAGQTQVVLDGRQVAQEVPAKLRLPVGKYEIRAMEGGKVLNSQPLEIKALSTVGISVKR
jgi:carboxyl-terminal processing protease